MQTTRFYYWNIVMYSFFRPRAANNFVRSSFAAARAVTYNALSRARIHETINKRRFQIDISYYVFNIVHFNTRVYTFGRISSRGFLRGPTDDIRTAYIRKKKTFFTRK